MQLTETRRFEHGSGEPGSASIEARPGKLKLIAPAAE
jgi:hypothetical protein